VVLPTIGRQTLECPIGERFEVVVTACDPRAW